jgi:hypothetical protein
MLAELDGLASRLGIDVRVEALEGGVPEPRGGLCYLRGRPLILVDDSLPIADRISIMATALAHFDLEGIYVPPAVRARIGA